MTWFEISLIAYLAAGIAATVLLIGQPRQPITPGTALLTLLVNGAAIAGVVVLR